MSRLSASRSGQTFGAFERLDHDGGEFDGVHLHRIRGARDADEPCPHPQRAARGKARCSRGMGRAADDDAMAAVIFVSLFLWPWKIGGPQGGSVFKQLRFQRLQRGFGNADIGNHNFAASYTAGHENMTGLLAEKGDRDVGFDRNIADHATGIAMEPSRHIDREHRDIERIELDRDGFRFFFELTGKARTEHRIDHKFGIPEYTRFDRFKTSIPELGHRGDIALEVGAAAEHGHTHIPARLLQITRGNQAIATIVAWPAEHQCLSRAPAPDSFIGHGAAGILHQCEKRHAVIGGVAICGITLFDGKDFAAHKTR